jgi:hypothetical protein
MNKFEKLYEAIKSQLNEEGEDVKSLLLQKKNLQDTIRNNPSNYPEENKIRQEKIRIIDDEIKVAKEKDNIQSKKEKITQEVDRLNKKKANDSKSNDSNI